MTNFFERDIIVDKVILSCLVKKGTGANFHKDRASHGLAYILEGEKTYEFSDGKTLTVRQNEIIYLPKNSTYKIINTIPGDTYAINFDCSNLNSEPFILSVKNTNSILYSYKKAVDAWTGKRDGYMYKTMSQLYSILCEMKKENSLRYVPSAKIRLIEPALEFIHNNYSTTQINMEEMAKLCNISYAYFRRIFFNAFATSPIKYVNNLKIERAKELLQTKTYSVTDACMLAGFSDPAYFCRFFKKEVGISPSQFDS